MRQLFLPACVLLVTWSGPTNPDARFTLDEFTGKGLAHAATVETTGKGDDAWRQEQRQSAREERASIVIKIPDDAIVSAPVRTASLPAEPVVPADPLANLSLEFPVPSGVVINNGIPIGIPLPPIAKPVIVRSTEEICDTLEKSAQINDLPAPFFIRLLFQESRFNPAVVSSAGAQGIAQFMPATAEGMGVSNPFDPREAIPASARLLNELLQQFGNLGLAAAAYNAGPKRIQDWLGSKGKGKLPEETQGYVKIITGKPVEHWTHAQARHPGEKLPQRAPCQESAGLLAWNGPDIVPMPTPSPLRAGQEKQQEKPQAKPQEKTVVLAALVRSDMKQADRTERLADAAKSVVPKPAAPAKTSAAKTDVKDDAKAAVKSAPVKRRIKTADVSADQPLNVTQQ